MNMFLHRPRRRLHRVRPLERCLPLLVCAAIAVVAAAASAGDSPTDDAAKPVARVENFDAKIAADSLPMVVPAPGLARSLPAADALAAPPPEPRHLTTGQAEADATAAALVERMLGKISRPDSAPRRLSLSEAVRFAVTNNPGIRSQAEIPNQDAWVPFGATGAFDPKLRASGAASSLHTQSASSLTAGIGRVVLDEEAVRTGASLSKLLRSGASVDLFWNSQIVDTTAEFYGLSPRYEQRLGLALRQPLLRNLWASRENTTVLVARSQADESLANFEASLSRFVAEVIDVYWFYEQAAAELEVSRRSVALARELVRDAEAKVDVGLLAPVAVKEALADAAARENRSITAENDLTIAAHDLQYKVMLGAAAGKAPEPVVPVEEHVVTPIDLDRQTSLGTAADCRAEIRAATYSLGRRRIEERNASNERLWDLNLVGHYTLLGLSGNPTDSRGSLDRSPYGGDWSRAWDYLSGNDFHDYGIGLELEIPFGNAGRRADLAIAEIEVRRASRDLEETISTVALDVDRALADVESSAKRVVASKAARELAEENLRNQTRRFELGAVTTKDVLDFQEKLAIALASEVRAITDHARSVTRLRMAEGTLLARFGIEIQSPDTPGKPWWYRF